MSVTLTREQAIRVFTKLRADMTEGSKHTKVILKHEGKIIFSTVLTRGSKEIPTGTAASIFRAMKLANNKNAARLLVACSFGRDDYLAYLRELSVI